MHVEVGKVLGYILGEQGMAGLRDLNETKTGVKSAMIYFTNGPKFRSLLRQHFWLFSHFFL